ncbi:MAG: peptidoglycan editing factor PgeF [Lachnospiraceae bacterium]|nr:peptidoglycan editing factor PgeF [Lachnospiraceae bacterium]MBQ6994154.1 peptidoglycan editing factor PgeF [Lachnospiraceae bacterium]
MKIKRKGNKIVCKENHFNIKDDDLLYFTFDSMEKTGIVKHCFSSRLGGVSKAHLGTMNLSYTRGDEKEWVDENYHRIAQVLGCEVENIVCSDQTHTTNVRKVTMKDKGKGVIRPRDYSDVDGLITNEPGIVLATFYADCVPLYIVDPVHKAIGLSHSGWRGTVNKMGAVTLEEMGKEYGTKPDDVHVVIGPSICQDCYEVSQDVAQAFEETFPNQKNDKQLLYQKNEEKFQLNLWYANYCVFREAGVLEEHIEVTDICTCCNPDILFSHRASNGMRGNLGAFLALK